MGTRADLILLIIILPGIITSIIQPTMIVGRDHMGGAQVKPYGPILNTSITLNRSYYLVAKRIFRTGDLRYFKSMIRGIIQANIDGDKYPDLIIWLPKTILIWSLRRGIYASINATYMYQKPIPIDRDGDGRIDYIILIDHRYMDAQPIFSFQAYRARTLVEKWYPETNTVKTIGSLNTFLESHTYVQENNVLLIPTAKVLGPRYYYGKYQYTEIGVAIVNLDTNTVNYRKIYSASTRKYGFWDTTDYLTDYESYLYRLPSGDLLLFPQGDEKLFILKPYPSLSVERTIKIQNPDNIRDGIILLPSTDTPRFPEANTLKGTVYSPYFYWTRQTSSIYVDKEYIVIPYGNLIVDPPTETVYGIRPYSSDYSRFEETRGIYIVNYREGYYIRLQLIDRRISHYILRSISSIKIISPEKTIIGGILYDTSHPNSKYEYQSMILEANINPKTGAVDFTIKYRIPQAYSDPRGMPIIFGENSYLTTAYLYVNNTELFYHSVYHPEYHGTLIYVGNPVILRPPLYIDIDGDGAIEPTLIVQYQRNSYTAWSHGSLNVFYAPTYIYNGAAWIAYFKHPKLHLEVNGDPEPGGNVAITVGIQTSPESTTLLEIMRDNKPVAEKYLTGSGETQINLTSLETGEYKLIVESNTTYTVYGYLGGEARTAQKIVFGERKEYTLFKARYNTRILVLSPPAMQTPNTYLPALEIKAVIQARIPGRGWVEITPTNTLKAGYAEGGTVKTITLRLLNNGVYSGRVWFPRPGTAKLTIAYTGNNIYTPSVAVETIHLLKYPVKITIDAPGKTYALTSLEIPVTTSYLMLVGGTWVEKPLYQGTLAVSISGERVQRQFNTLPQTTISIPQDDVLPPGLTITIKYRPPYGFTGTYYSPSTAAATVMVEKIMLEVKVNSTVYKGDLLNATIYDIVGGKPRPTVSAIKAVLENRTWRTEVPVNGSILAVNTSNLKPGNYTLNITVTDHPEAYVDPSIDANTTILEPDTRIILQLDPAIKISGSRNHTYTLTPVLINITVENPRPDEKIILEIDGGKIELTSRQQLWWVFKYPGKHLVKAYIKNRPETVAYAWITVYPQPVGIMFSSSNGILEISTRAITGPAPGTLHVRITRMDGGLVVDEYIDTNGTTDIPLPAGENTVYSIHVEYEGNRSYLPAQKTASTGAPEPRPPLPEPPVIPILLFLTTLLYFLKRGAGNGPSGRPEGIRGNS